MENFGRKSNQNLLIYFIYKEDFSMTKKSIIILCVIHSFIAITLTGCSNVIKSIPSAGIGFDVGAMDRNLYVIIDNVEGSSTTQTFFFGLIKIVDNNKLIFAGIPLFEDKYAFPNAKQAFSSVTTADRAFYKALEISPDADTIIKKSYSKKNSGIPFLFSDEKVTFYGKAIKLKSDQELSF